jgi:hypothetical protein
MLHKRATALRTIRFTGILSTEIIAGQNIHLRGHGPQVIEIATSLVCAYVVEFQGLRNRAVTLLPKYPMNNSSCPIESNLPITRS